MEMRPFPMFESLDRGACVENTDGRGRSGIVCGHPFYDRCPIRSSGEVQKREFQNGADEALEHGPEVIGNGRFNYLSRIIALFAIPMNSIISWDWSSFAGI